MLTVRDLAKTYATGVGLRPTSFTVAAGETVTFLGPSGSGKSTLLRLICGLETSDGGSVSWGDMRLDRLPPHRRGIAFTAQRPALYPQLTVEAQLRRATANPGDSGADAVEMLRLGPLLARYPHQLSGGERQRVALAKMLLRRAPLWLLDEPFGSLDPVFREEFRCDLHLLGAASRATMLIVTHDPTDALALGRRVGVLGDGVLQQLGTPEELQARPGNRFTAFCLGRMNLVDGVVGGGESSGTTFVSECRGITLPLPAALHPASSLTLGIRPEDVQAAPLGTPPTMTIGGVLRGWAVVFTEPFGSGWLVTVARGRTRLRVMAPPGSPPGIGTSTDWYLPIDKCVWFPGPDPAKRG